MMPVHEPSGRPSPNFKLQLTIYIRCTTLPVVKNGEGFFCEYTYFGASRRIGYLDARHACLDGSYATSGNVENRSRP